MNIHTYDDLEGLGFSLSSLLNTGVKTFTDIKGAKDAKAIAQANASAAAAASRAEEARWAAQARQGAGSKAEVTKIAAYALGAAALAYLAIKGKRKYSRR